MRQGLKRFFKRRVLPFFLIVFGAFVLFVAVFWLKCAFVKPAVGLLSVSAQHGNAAPDIGEKNRRPLEDSYFSYPEWYTVWRSEEPAPYVPKNLPIGCPRFA